METQALLPDLMTHYFAHPNKDVAQQMTTWVLALERGQPPLTVDLPKQGITSVLIVGTGKLAHLLAWDITVGKNGLTLAGFIDQNPDMTGLTCLGLPVYLNCKHAPIRNVQALLLSIEGEHDQALQLSLKTELAQQGHSLPVLSWKDLLMGRMDET
jgi:FlaA1/EpsC-like NDP-sugar epimerase